MNTIGLSAALSGASLFGNHILSLACRRSALNPTPDESVLGTGVLFHFRTSWMCVS